MLWVALSRRHYACGSPMRRLPPLPPWYPSARPAPAIALGLAAALSFAAVSCGQGGRPATPSSSTPGPEARLRTRAVHVPAAPTVVGRIRSVHAVSQTD
jgi:hypothetical protein